MKNLFSSVVIIIALLTQANNIMANDVQLINKNIISHDQFFESEISFYDQEGVKKFIEDYEDYNILLVFWATWCESCVEELPKLDNLQKDFRRLPFKIIAISEDYQGTQLIEDHFKEYEIRFLEIFHDRGNKLMTKLNIAGLPTALLIGKDGKLKLELKGQIKWEKDEIRALIIKEMGEEHILPKNSFSHEDFLKKIYHKENKTNMGEKKSDEK